MANPSFVTQGNTTHAAATSVTGAIAGSLVVGNVALSFIVINASNQTAAVSGGGSTWTLGATVSNASAGQSGAWAWTIVTAGTVGPTWTWTTSAVAGSGSVQYSGNASPTPVGASTSNINTTSNLQAVANSVTTTAQNSRIVQWVGGGFDSGANSIMAQHTPIYTQRVVTQPFNGMQQGLFDGVIYLSGVASDSQAYDYNTGGGNQLWVTFTVEVLGTGSAPAGEPAERSTQVTQQVLESYSNATNLRSTQVTLQVLRTQNSTATPYGIIKPELSVLQRGHPLAQGLIMAWLFDELNLLTTLLNIDKGVFEKISNTSVTATAGTPQWLSNSLAITQGAPNGSAIDYRSSGQVDTNIWTPVEGLKQITIATRCNNYSATSANGGWVLSKGNTPELGLSNLTDLKTWFYFNNTGISSAVSAVPPQTWGDLVATYDGANQRIFWNNVQVASGALSNNTSPVTGNHLLFGDRGAASANYDIDCIMIWNRALSQQEIAQWSFDPYAMFRMRTINVYKFFPPVFDVSGLVEIEW